MPERPLVVGLTGSIGMGKSETAKMFARLGLPVYDADAAVHGLYELGGEAVAKVGEAFPGAVREGRVDRPALARMVMGDAAALARLESIVHPLVAGTRRAFIEACAALGVPLIVLEIPLLYETGAEAEMDRVVVVSAPPEVQRARALSRAGMTAEKLDYILSRQMPDAAKRARAHYVVDTSQGFDRTFEQVKQIVEELRPERPHA